MFKKIMAISLVIFVFCSLVACSSDESTTTITPNDNTTQTEETTATNIPEITPPIEVTKPTEDANVTEPTTPNNETPSTEPSQPEIETEPEVNDDIDIAIEDFGKDNEYFQEILNNMKNYDGAIVICYPKLPNVYEEVNFSQRIVHKHYDSNTFLLINYKHEGSSTEYGSISTGYGNEIIGKSESPMEDYIKTYILNEYNYIKNPTQIR